MPAIDAYLDPATGDLPEVNRVCTGIELIQQRIRRRLRRGTGEWFLDPSVGLPLIAWRDIKPPPEAVIVSQIQAEIRAVPGVVATRNFASAFDPATRRLTVTGDVIVAAQQVTSIVVIGSSAAHNTMSFGVFFSSGSITGGIPRPTSGRP